METIGYIENFLEFDNDNYTNCPQLKVSYYCSDLLSVDKLLFSSYYLGQNR